MQSHNDSQGRAVMAKHDLNCTYCKMLIVKGSVCREYESPLDDKPIFVCRGCLKLRLDMF